MKENKERILTVKIDENSIIVKHESDLCNQTYAKFSSFEYVVLKALKGSLKIAEI